MDYDELRTRFADALADAAQAQLSGRLSGIEGEYDELDGLLPRSGDERYRKLHVALQFWDCWIDSSNHHWLYYDGMTADSWPHLARGIAEDLRADREVQNEAVQALVLPQEKGPSLGSRLWSAVSGRGRRTRA